MSGEAILAIDGPAGAGKSTVARQCARVLGVEMLDTGAMYRAVTLAVLRTGNSIDDAPTCTAIAERAVIDLGAGETRLDGEDVSSAIRSPEVTRAVSAVSAHRGVRAALVAHQRRWSETHGRGVVEGRDIGSVVFPDARCKIYLDATPRERAERRRRDEVAAGRAVDVEALVIDIERRDALDSNRAESPLVRAHDAIVIDTSGRTIDDIVEQIVECYRAANEVS
jgi:CMP/dCMP kinase